MRSNQSALGFSHLGLENLQGWRSHSISGQPVPMLDCPHGEKDFPYICFESLMFQLGLVASCPLTMRPIHLPVEVLVLKSV